jgi:hypothetical protein
VRSNHAFENKAEKRIEEDIFVFSDDSTCCHDVCGNGVCVAGHVEPFKPADGLCVPRNGDV